MTQYTVKVQIVKLFDGVTNWFTVVVKRENTGL